MSQNIEAQEFLKRVEQHDDLQFAINPALEDEAVLRHLFAVDPQNSRLRNPYVGLVDVFVAPSDIRKTRARNIQHPKDKDAHYVFALEERRRKDGEPSMVTDIEEFKKNWSIFTEGSLSQLTDWNNVIAAGGSVLASLLPIPEKSKASKRSIRKYYHQEAFLTSDVDLFLWGLTPKQAEAKAIAIYEAVRDSVPWDTTCVRTKHAISIHSQYPYRAVQIVLRLYGSPAEVLAGFDVDSCCVAYDGNRVLANPRSITAMMTQSNQVDMTRRSPSYEVRLAKYSARGFEVHVPTLRRQDIDPTIFERSLIRIEGLARLLVLEKISDPTERASYLENRRTLRGRPSSSAHAMRRCKRIKGDLKAEAEVAGLEMNDYDTTAFHIPYGFKWDAKKIKKLIYQTDLGMNSTFNPKNKDRRLHRHPAFFGTMAECLEDCCEYCPAPLDEDEKLLQETEDKQFIRGRIQFIQEDPGRQSISGSFQPIDAGDWSVQAYIDPTQSLFDCIAKGDRRGIATILKSGLDLRRRDYLGRTPLHLAILCGHTEIACDLIDAGDRMTARVVDGRTSLHLAAQLGLDDVVKKLLYKSEQNKVEAERIQQKFAVEAQKAEGSEEDGDGDDPNRPSSEGDWSSEEDPPRKKAGPNHKLAELNALPAEDNAIPDDIEDAPDILDITLTDWDSQFSPLGHAIVRGHVTVVETLLIAGADAKTPTKASDYIAATLHPLALTILTEDDEKACKIAERLIRAGAIITVADSSDVSIFHQVVHAGKVDLAATMLRCDHNAKVALNFLAQPGYQTMLHPLVTAVSQSRAMTAMLLAHGANVVITREDYDRARDSSNSSRSYYRAEKNFLGETFMPVEVSIRSMNDIYTLLVALGAEINLPSREAAQFKSETYRRNLIDHVQYQINCLRKGILELESSSTVATKPVPTRKPGTWEAFYVDMIAQVLSPPPGSVPLSIQKQKQRERSIKQRNLDYFLEVLSFLRSKGAESWDERNPMDRSKASRGDEDSSGPTPPAAFPPRLFVYRRYLGDCRQLGDLVADHNIEQYQQLFEACWSGNNKRIQELCLPKHARKQGKRDPIPIAIMAVPMRNGINGKHGYNPLSVAIQARRWDTVRLILAVAAAQYQKPEQNETNFNMFNIALDDDDGSYESDDGQGLEEFTDIATRFSSICTDVPPEELLASPSAWLDSERNLRLFDPIKKAIQEDDLEAFVKIADMMAALEDPLILSSSNLVDILCRDSPTLLDEFIRRTGLGIRLDSSHEVYHTVEAETTRPGYYQGLSIHGKKRADLAKHGGPDATAAEQVAPLLLRAAFSGAKKIISYLSGAAPLLAYQFYSRTHKDDERAELLAKIDLGTKLPELLGIPANPRNETPILTALQGRQSLDTLNHLIATFPNYKTTFLHSRVKFTGISPLHAVCGMDLSNEHFDWFLSNGVDPEVVDHRGWNIFHLMCAFGNFNLLKHAIGELSQVVKETLFRQQSRPNHNTPLAIAVKTGRFHIVEYLLGLKLDGIKSTLDVRDVNGLTPLHLAINYCHARSLGSLITHSSKESLFLENGIGETPLETASLRYVLHISRNGFRGRVSAPPPLAGIPIPGNYEAMTVDEEDVEKLSSLVASYRIEDTLCHNSRILPALEEFASRSEKALKDHKLRREEIARMEEEERLARVNNTLVQDLGHTAERVDVVETYKVISAAVKGCSGINRVLVKLPDVQLAVQALLKKSKRTIRVPVDEDVTQGVAPYVLDTGELLPLDL